MWFFAFTVIASWASASANRPICAELVKTPAARAQIISMWMVLEQSSSAIFGAPLVGFLMSSKGDQADDPTQLAGGYSKARRIVSKQFNSLFQPLCFGLVSLLG